MTVDPRSDSDLARLRELVASEADALQRDRYRVVLLALDGYYGPELTRDQIAQTVERSRQFVDAWVYRYRDYGLDGLVAGKPTGKPPTLNAQEAERFKQRMLAGPTDADGVCTLRGRDAQRIIQNEFGKPLKLSAVYDLMHRVGLSCLKPVRMCRWCSCWTTRAGM